MIPSDISRASSASRCQVIQLKRVDEQRGSLCVAEVGQHVSFAVQRVYWIFDVPRTRERARHAHREQHEFLIAVHGTFSVHCDDGDVRDVYELDSPDTGLLLPPMVFHHLDNFSPGAICLVLASGPYDPSEYVYEYDEFREFMARR